ncbi:ATP-binding protein, partial [Endozoicomonas sp.]|uniref:ATP-binding protein n=1 Tax=Endozoicomonas sp. TaxID=1892382 RepID=UPI00383B3314
DPTRINQAINNLLGNAIKFTHEGEISPSLEFKPLDKDSLEVIINITDTGIGIPREAIDAIFTPFTQANNEIYQSYGGSGMGLALTKELVTAMNGSIQVISREGHGSTFSIRLPLTKPENANSETIRPLINHPIVLACKESTQQICYRMLSHWNVPCSIVDLYDASLDFNGPSDGHKAVSLVITDQKALALNMARHHPDHKTIFISFGQPQGMPDNVVWLSLPVTQQKLYRTCAEVIGIKDPGRLSAAKIDSWTHLKKSLPSKPIECRKKRVLVVEDNAINRLVTEGMLEQLGHDVELAHNGKDCLTTCNSQSFDLILMDCNMPLMDGYTATRHLRASPGTQSTPIIALTANALDEHKECCRKAGMNDHISKPFNKKELNRVLELWLS